ncbi:acyl carrier protein [Aquimarina hainanensis]|uniref:Acyl carrier protein n=1 Tax=Aquimarina hainanensis TaxID=1578017 RepID=A0ABW5NEI4_9FLAO|nr:acyl carrier protein [Aquimarina sp. TRL1]QKX06858.1 acyl carrier protein [Aquimarina sp. TRL1]
MTVENILTGIKESFVIILEHDDFELTTETVADDVEGWESITHMMLIGEVEKKFNVKFKLMDLMKMENVGDLVAAIKKELN